MLGLGYNLVAMYVCAFDSHMSFPGYKAVGIIACTPHKHAK